MFSFGGQYFSDENRYTLTSCKDVEGGMVFGYHVNDPRKIWCS